MQRRFPLLTLAFGLVCLSTGDNVAAQQPRPKIEDVIAIEFPKDGYTFTLAEVAKGVQFPYRIVIKQDYEGAIPRAFPPSFAEAAGPGGLYPREAITGNGQSYCLSDSGLAFPPPDKVVTLKMGTYKHNFEWDGLNWAGPSDTRNPKGKACPAGTYDVSFTGHGKVVTEKGKVPYQITRKTKLVLK